MIIGLKIAADLAHQRITALHGLQTRPATAFVCALLLVGFMARVSPIFDPAERLFWQLMSEDGYLMQTVARNFALGLGLSTAEGTMPTNGVQPLATFLFAGLHFLAGGSKLHGILLVTVFSAIVAVLSAFLFFRVLKRIFADYKFATSIAAGGAALWFASPLIVTHSTNGLETGVYYLTILAALDYYLAATLAAPALSWRQRGILGVLLGLAFLGRNDAVFLIAALLVSHLLIGPRDSTALARRLTDCATAGVISIAIASPWLLNNYLLFGTVVPISGIAQSHSAKIGANLAMIPANLFEAMFLYAPVPRRFETLLPIAMVTSTAVMAIGYVSWAAIGRRSLHTRRFWATGAIFAFGIGAYYGLFFGAAHFVTRYLSATSVFLWTMALAAAISLLAYVFKNPAIVKRVVWAPLIAGVFIMTASAALRYAQGDDHMHRQVVVWVEENVRDDQWVGAVQTGTLGYFHDRTINLDGKVNPEALRVLVETGDIRPYVAASNIAYLADWRAIADWHRTDAEGSFAAAFEVVVDDPEKNLGVLRRRSIDPNR